jgi:hypothetical protein
MNSLCCDFVIGMLLSFLFAKVVLGSETHLKVT